jgi:secretion/DNA translocation related TadE-like protein
MTRERGSASVVMVAVVVVGLVLALGAARLGTALIARARADSAADAAALAAADALALGSDAAAARAAARETAASNDARLVECDCSGAAAEVLVEVDIPGLGALGTVARGRARAEIRIECRAEPALCDE